MERNSPTPRKANSGLHMVFEQPFISRDMPDPLQHMGHEQEIKGWNQGAQSDVSISRDGSKRRPKSKTNASDKAMSRKNSRRDSEGIINYS